MRLLVLLGVVLIGVAALLGRHTSHLETRLRQLQIRPATVTRWSITPFDAFQPAGRPILIRLRLTLVLVYVFAVIGGDILFYACGKM